MKIALRSHHTTLAELNITPLLDLVFVLLVIFIITTPQLMNNLELALPSGKTDSPKPAAPARIRVIGRNQIQLDSRAMSFAEFKTELARRKAAMPEISVVVEGADTANYQAVVDVLEVIQQLNITQAGLATADGGEALQKN
jgi:biopolymer transport protein ExbD